MKIKTYTANWLCTGVTRREKDQGKGSEMATKDSVEISGMSFVSVYSLVWEIWKRRYLLQHDDVLMKKKKFCHSLIEKENSSGPPPLLGDAKLCRRGYLLQLNQPEVLVTLCSYFENGANAETLIGSCYTVGRLISRYAHLVVYQLGNCT